jgi:hypothetical protein
MNFKAIAAAIVALIILCISMLLVGRVSLFGPAPTLVPSPAQSTNAIQQSRAVPHGNSKKFNPTSDVASAIIDPDSLVTDSANPTITGSVSNIPDIGIIISKGKTVPAAQYNGPGSVPNQVWGGFSGNPGFSILHGHWSAKVQINRDAYPPLPVLQPGIYTVAVYGYSYLLTYGVLTVNNGAVILSPIRVPSFELTRRAAISTLLLIVK